uniref:ABC-three component systems C-terminal domain-containing protein n=1 Tax=Candidatus Kentrum sp. UNK TaxID=2126344 RepID=A0A451AKU4_9GAMM|nr:MAG: hypothetical protein BECKUNK1418G_GA0071005_11026 [Candidatus Kentron sp. UNK]VFK72140.1 MAG: hypothetical protein BECKUNK1418H_GA0071006_10986 [Candidatus Kentron sp. UNK]
MNDHSAVSSAVGYYYQGCYALVSLLDCDADNAIVSVERRDDLELAEDSIITLKQLKHKPGTISPVSLKSDDIWNTIGNWCQFVDEPDVYFHFVTTGIIKEGDPLEQLIVSGTDKHLSDDSVKFTADAMTSEAERVRSGREEAEKVGKAKKDLPYKKRWPGCHAYLDLNKPARLDLVRRIRVMPKQFLSADIQNEVEKRLQTTVQRTIRGQVAERLIEWWDREVAKSLLGQREAREIEKHELQAKCSELIAGFHEDRLPDDFSGITPPATIETPSNMARQIQWVEGGEHWIRRAKEARWRARGQRNRWLEESPTSVSKLGKFDRTLEEEWRY